MAGKRSQTAPGEAVYLLHEDLRRPTQGDEKFRWLDAGSKVTTSDLAGLNVAALESGGMISQVSEASVACEVCDDKKTYTPSKLTEHYRAEHPALAPPEEV